MYTSEINNSYWAPHKMNSAYSKVRNIDEWIIGEVFVITKFVAGLSISINMHKSVNNPEATLNRVLSVIVAWISMM